MSWPTTPPAFWPELRMTLAHMQCWGGLTTADVVAVMDAVKHGRYKIVPSTNPDGGI